MILIIGGSGFVGSFLINELQDRNTINLDKNTSPFYRDMNNPWQRRHVTINVMRSCYLFYVKYPRFKIASFIRTILRKTPCYPLLKKIRSAVVNEKYN